MKILKTLFLALTSGLLLFSCDPGPSTPEADLLIRVEGYLSGNSREGIMVQVYRTREDARDQFDPLTPPLWTDHYGEVEVFGLLTNRKYFVRADANAAKTIRKSRKLDYGSNICIIRIL